MSAERESRESDRPGRTCRLCGGPADRVGLVCTECRRRQSREWYQRNIETARARRRAYANAHRDEQRKRDRKAKAADPEGWAARHREYVRRSRAPKQAAEREERERERAEYLARIAVEGKPCSRCKETKPLAEFAIDQRYKSGHHSLCRDCKMLLDREHTRKRRALMREGKVEYDVILARHGMVCHLCGLPIATRRDLEMDHVVPLAKGGTHSEENVRPAHRDCNRRKGSKS